MAELLEIITINQSGVERRQADRPLMLQTGGTAMFKWIIALVVITGTALLAACTGTSQQPAEPTPAPAGGAPGADLAAVKQYTKENATQMKAGTVLLAETAQAYYDLMAAHQFDYDSAWAADQARLTQLVADAKTHWLTASTHYELDEGIIAGVPSLAQYDVWIDAGPSAEEDPAEAFAWTLELPDGRALESPGNFFHSLLEPTIWGTNPAYTGMTVDLDGDGAVELGEALPEANVFLAATQGLDSATEEMIAAVEGWEPSLSDVFTALVVMIPTMNEYFEQWKLSAFIAGAGTEETAFIGTSRLFDINGILNGLDVSYDNIGPLVQDADPALHRQIDTGFSELRAYVSDLYGQEQAGTSFTAEQADLFGTEAQEKATSLAGQVSQAAALLNVTLEE
jgi:hypothetical protein